MGKVDYSIDLCRDLERVAGEGALELPYRKPRYDTGDVLEIDFTTVWPETEGHARFRVDKFVGGGFAGQVYRCTLDRVRLDPEAPLDLREGGIYAIKIMLPPSRFSCRFRDLIYWIAFQSPFSAQVNRAASRAGLLWQKFALLAARTEYGRDDAVADVYASFYDDNVKAYGEIREWVEGRTWHLEADTDFRQRRHWRTLEPRVAGSPEYIAKRQFMHRFVRMLHAMGAPELARQYEWWTMKSQPNVLKRAGADGGAAAGLCAVDFRAGLALLPFLPMSPADVPLIFAGIRRGSCVQFDRPDLRRLRAFAERHAGACPELPGMAKAIETYDCAARAAMPDITHQGWRLLRDPGLRKTVRQGLIDGYRSKDLLDADFARLLGSHPARFAGFYVLGAIPFLGRLLRKLQGNAAFGRHVKRMLTSAAYFRLATRTAIASRLVVWHRSGRSGRERTALLLRRPLLFWVERLTAGWLAPGLHRVVADPRYVVGRLRAGLRFMRNFYRDAKFREQWLTNVVEDGYKDGMLRPAEREEILACVSDPFIVKYLKCLAVHFMTLPVTQIVSVITGGIVAGVALAHGAGWGEAGIKFGIIVGIFQVIPISPGSICRGLYVVYVMIKERNMRDYVVAAPLSFAKYIGYLAFPIQMTATYPALARFMASRWATDAVHVIPVFGEKGALFEHMIFDLFFNLPRRVGQWARPRIRGLLDAWLVVGLVLIAVGAYAPIKHFATGAVDTANIEAVLGEAKTMVTVFIAGLAIFILPRLLFYPMLRRRKR